MQDPLKARLLQEAVLSLDSEQENKRKARNKRKAAKRKKGSKIK
jgi:hypothetical protein